MGNRFDRPFFHKHQAPRGSVVVTEADLQEFDCPACKGAGKKLLADLAPLRLHTERAWLCGLCGGPGVINTTEKTYKDLCVRFDVNPALNFVVKN